MGVLPAAVRPFGQNRQHGLVVSDSGLTGNRSSSSLLASSFYGTNNGFTDNAAFLIPLGIALSTLSLLTFLGNAMVVHAIRTERKLHTVSNMFILSLAIADMIVGLMVMPLSSTYVIFGDWILGLFVCQLWLVIDYTASTASIFNLLILSLDRYWSIRSPLKYLCKRTKKRALAMIGIVWMISALWAIPIIGWHLWYNDGIRKHPNNVCETEFSDSVAFKITTSIANFIVPMSLMVILYYKIYREIKRRGNFSDMNHSSVSSCRSKLTCRKHQNPKIKQPQQHPPSMAITPDECSLTPSASSKTKCSKQKCQECGNDHCTMAKSHSKQTTAKNLLHHYSIKSNSKKTKKNSQGNRKNPKKFCDECGGNVQTIDSKSKQKSSQRTNAQETKTTKTTLVRRFLMSRNNKRNRRELSICLEDVDHHPTEQTIIDKHLVINERSQNNSVIEKCSSSSSSFQSTLHHSPNQKDIVQTNNNLNLPTESEPIKNSKQPDIDQTKENSDHLSLSSGSSSSNEDRIQTKTSSLIRDLKLEQLSHDNGHRIMLNNRYLAKRIEKEQMLQQKQPTTSSTKNLEGINKNTNYYNDKSSLTSSKCDNNIAMNPSNNNENYNKKPSRKRLRSPSIYSSLSSSSSNSSCSSYSKSKLINHKRRETAATAKEEATTIITNGKQEQNAAIAYYTQLTLMSLQQPSPPKTKQKSTKSSTINTDSVNIKQNVSVHDDDDDDGDETHTTRISTVGSEFCSVNNGNTEDNYNVIDSPTAANILPVCDDHQPNQTANMVDESHFQLLQRNHFSGVNVKVEYIDYLNGTGQNIPCRINDESKSTFVNNKSSSSMTKTTNTTTTSISRKIIHPQTPNEQLNLNHIRHCHPQNKSMNSTKELSKSLATMNDVVQNEQQRRLRRQQLDLNSNVFHKSRSFSTFQQHKNSKENNHKITSKHDNKKRHSSSSISCGLSSSKKCQNNIGVCSISLCSCCHNNHVSICDNILNNNKFNLKINNNNQLINDKLLTEQESTGFPKSTCAECQYNKADKMLANDTDDKKTTTRTNISISSPTAMATTTFIPLSTVQTSTNNTSTMAIASINDPGRPPQMMNIMKNHSSSNDPPRTKTKQQHKQITTKTSSSSSSSSRPSPQSPSSANNNDEEKKHENNVPCDKLAVKNCKESSPQFKVIKNKKSKKNKSNVGGQDDDDDDVVVVVDGDDDDDDDDDDRMAKAKHSSNKSTTTSSKMVDKHGTTIRQLPLVSICQGSLSSNSSTTTSTSSPQSFSQLTYPKMIINNGDHQTISAKIINQKKNCNEVIIVKNNQTHINQGHSNSSSNCSVASANKFKQNYDYQNEIPIPTNKKINKKPTNTNMKRSTNYSFYGSFRLKTFNFSLSRHDGLNESLEESLSTCKCIAISAAAIHRNELKREESSRLRQEKKAARQLGVILGAFILCWMPYIITYVVTAYCAYCISLTVHQVTIWLGYLNSFLNPFLYALCNENFKHAFKKMLGRLQQPQHFSYNFDNNQTTLANNNSNYYHNIQRGQSFRLTKKTSNTNANHQHSSFFPNDHNSRFDPTTTLPRQTSKQSTLQEQTITIAESNSSLQATMDPTFTTR